MKQKIENILKSYQNIEFALLFGSYANDKQSTLSDVDIAIYTKKEIDILEYGEIIATLECKLDKKIDLVLLTDLYKTNAKLSFNIINQHKILFCKNEELYKEFKTNTLKYYFDISPMYKMFDDAIKTRIENGTFGQNEGQLQKLEYS